MALTPGTASVSAQGIVTGSGLALAIYNARAAVPAIANAPSSTSVQVRQWIADDSEAIATTIVAALQSDAEVAVSITTSDGGLQRYDGNPTQAPSSTKTLGGTIA